MHKSATYKEKFQTLRPWLPSILEAVKKDLKNEHLKSDVKFCKEYLSGKNFHKLTTDDLVEAYSRALVSNENAEALAEFISNRWLLKNTEMYEFFENKLSAIDPNFTELEEIDAPRSREIVTEAAQQFGAARTYLFSVINSVVFPKEIYGELERQAETDRKQVADDQRAHAEKMSTETLLRNHEQQTARLVDKYEKKLAGLEKKYLKDTESLKKQLVALQRKLSPA